MAIVGIHHVQLAMPPRRESAAVGFYQELLGIPQVPKPAHLAARGGCWFETDQIRIHLGVEEEFRPARRRIRRSWYRRWLTSWSGSGPREWR